MKRPVVTTLGSMITAGIASLCCIGPLVAAVVGVGNVGVFSVFVAYRPYFIVVTMLLLGLGFFLTYRRHEVVCEDGTCRVESAGTWNKIAMWIAAVIAAGAMAVPYMPWTQEVFAQPIPEQQTSSLSNAIAVVNIEGMDCEACAAGLQATLGRIAGVTRALVNVGEGNAVLEYDSTRVQPQKFIAEINDMGFTATIGKGQYHARTAKR